MDQTLVVRFIDEEKRLEPGDVLSFGRSADLELDTNRHLHRIVGRFEVRGGMWWLHNSGSRLALKLVDQDGPSAVTLAPGRATPIPFARAKVRVEAGRSEYELEIETSVVEAEADGIDLNLYDDRTETLSTTHLPLTEDQKALLAVLAESRLRDPHGPLVLPTNSEAAARLGWSITKFNRKLDYVCAKFHRAGVPGMRGSMDKLAKNRREAAVKHSLDRGLLSLSDLYRVTDSTNM